jgi:signal transduction histidine kinase
MPAPRSIPTLLRRLADQVVEAHDLAEVARLLLEALPGTLGVGSATLLVWNRKLDAFEALTPGQGGARPLSPEGPGVATPEARYLVSDGHLIETPGGSGEGALVPLMARAGLTGMLVLGPRRGRRRVPYRPAELRALWLVASRAALALEHLLYQRELIATERMAALGAMAGMLAHDFRGPMTVIRGYAEVLAEGTRAENEVRQYAGLIVQMVDRLERMTTETLDYVREGALLAARPVAATELVADLLRAIALEVPGLEIDRQVDLPAEARLTADADKLRRALVNLAHNAREATRGRGRLRLEARLGGQAAGVLELVVADDGPGVPEEIRDRLFEPFVTSGRCHGTGLGLAVARRFVEDHGGRIELLPGGPGARFRIQLPLLPGPQGMASSASPGASNR